MISRRKVSGTGATNEGVSPEGDLEAPRDNSSSTEATAASGSDPRVGRNPLSPPKAIVCEQVGIICLLNDIIVGIILGVVIIAFTIFLDYQNILHFQSAHKFRHAAIHLLNDKETIANIKESSELKFMDRKEYESIRREIDGVAEFLAFRNEDLGERTAEGDEKHKEKERITPEFESIMLRSNDAFELDKYCGSCMWVDHPPTTCDERVQFTIRRYGSGPNAAKLNAMGLGTCTCDCTEKQ